MSSENRKSLKPSGRVTSTARSIAASIWGRRFASFLMFDLVAVAVAFLAFVFACNGQLPGPVQTWEITGNPFASAQELFTNTHDPAMGDPLCYKPTLEDGTTHAFNVTDTFDYARPVVYFTLGAQALSLIAGLFETRRIRRKLKPLNELALTAEALGQAAADDLALGGNASGMDKIESLEAAISSASVDAPNVSTGDKDLRSIEVALNGLLRQMQEAKLQQMRFVSDASHELRTPIAVLQGYVNMLDRWGKTDEAVLEESIEALKQETNHMQELVEQLLFLARGDSGRNNLEKVPFDLRQVVREVWEESIMIDSDHIYELGFDPDDETLGPLSMVGDVAMVKQSMRVMVQNAAKYSPAGSTISLDARRAEADVAYTVTDEGIGMSAEEVSHAFDRFWRSDSARSRTDGGTGLGLSIAKWIVEAHDGRIEVRSHQGVGTRFTVRFPATNAVMER